MIVIFHVIIRYLSFRSRRVSRHVLNLIMFTDTRYPRRREQMTIMHAHNISINYVDLHRV